MLFRKKTQIVGLDIGSHTVKMAQIIERGNELVLVKFGMKDLPAEVIVDGTVMDRGQVSSVISELMSELDIKSKDVAISVSGHSVIIKRITLPEMSEEELSESITWEAEQYIPFAIEDVNLDFQILGPSSGEGANTMDVVLVAAKKDKINDYTSLVAEAGLNPKVMDVDAFALENMFEVNYELEPDRVDALVNIGAEVMNVNVLKNGQSVFTRDSSVGGNLYSEALQKDLGVGIGATERLMRGEDTDMATFEQARRTIEAIASDIASEVGRTLDFFRATTGIETVDRVVMCGGGSLVAGFVDVAAERLEVKVELANPFRNITVDPGVDQAMVNAAAPAAAVVVGLALRREGY